MLFRFHSLLTVIGPRTSNLYPVRAAYLPDGDGYVILGERDVPGPAWEAELLAAGPADSVTVEIDGRSFEAEVGPPRRLSLGRCRKVRRRGFVPLVRLTAAKR